MQYRTIYYKPTELYHYGVMGMKWGVRRYQNPDGSLTAAGRGRYNESTGMYTASNGMKVAPARNRRAAAMRKFGVTKTAQVLAAHQIKKNS